MEDLRLGVAKKKLSLIKAQEKRNVSAAELEIEASEEHRAMKFQRHKVDRIEEFIKNRQKERDAILKQIIGGPPFPRRQRAAKTPPK